MGDEAVQAMDFDAQGMHFWLVCISWQRTPPCSVPNDQAQLRRWLRNPSNETWNRVWPQIKKAWKQAGKNLINFGMKREYKKQRAFSDSRKRNALNRWKIKPNKHHASALQVPSTSHALQSSSASADVTPISPQGGDRLSARRKGTNQRALGTNPRAKGTTARQIAAKKRRPSTYSEHRPPESEIMSGEDIAKVKAALPAKLPAVIEEQKPVTVGHGSNCACEDCFKTMTKPRA